MVTWSICFCFLFYTSVYCGDYSNETIIEDDVDDPPQTFESDLLGFNDIMDLLRPNPDNGDSESAALMDEKKKWPNAIVYYKISSYFSCMEKCIINEAMHEMEKKTCLNFIEDDQKGSYISILPATICASYVGRLGDNKQELFLSPECAIVAGQVIHELMHAIGFFHEQSRKDRDDFIDINWNNIANIHNVQFMNHGLGNVTSYSLPYDYESIMHYEPYAFAYDPTIMTITGKQGQEIGQRKRLSDLDVRRINIHYNCTDKTIACHDIDTNCGSQPDLKTSCRSRQFLMICRRTCGQCNKHRNDRQFYSNYNCKTATDRCSKFTASHNCHSSANFRKIQQKICYQSCHTCD